MERIDTLFNIERGSLQSSKSSDGQYTFITAAEEWKTHDQYSHNCEALIFAAAASGSLGRTHYFKGKFISSDLCFILTPKDKINYPVDLKFYYFLFNNLKQRIVKQTKTGTSKEAINFKSFSSYLIPYLNIEQQDFWKKKLVKLEDIKNNLSIEFVSQEKIAQKLRQSILKLAAQGKLVPQDPNDEPASVFLNEINESKRKSNKKIEPLTPIKIGEEPFRLPKGWEWARLGNIIDLTSGVTLGKMYSQELVSVPYLRVANVQRGYIDVDHVKQILVPEKEREKYKIQLGDLLMVEGGDWDKVGRCAIWKHDINPCIHQNHIFRIRFLGQIFNTWGELYLNSPVARRYFESCSKQTTNLASINRTQLCNLIFPLPPKFEQSRILARVQTMLIKCDGIEQSISEKQAHLRQILEALILEAIVSSRKEEKKISIPQMQLLGLFIRKLKDRSRPMLQGEMGLAKYLYLTDRIYGVSTGFQFQQHNFGPYTPDIKKCLTAHNRYFKKTGRPGYEVYDLDENAGDLFVNPLPQQQLAEKAISDLISIFSQFKKNRSRELELMASVCWLAESLKTIEFEDIWRGLESWKTPKRNEKNKSEIFTPDEIKRSLAFIVKKGWHEKLLKLSTVVS
jgi:type I restriction enzyme S subunit